MNLRFLGQPFSAQDQIGRALTTALEGSDRTAFWGTSAWVKHSGLSRIVLPIQALRGRGGTADLILGLDAHIATREGLELALVAFDHVYVLHDPGRKRFRGRRTFHPKFYVVEGTAAATIILGSGNLTKGGLYTNFEAAVRVELDLTVNADRRFLGSVRAYYQRLRALPDACQLLDGPLLEKLLRDPDIGIVSEAVANQVRTGTTAAMSSLFGTPLAGLASAPTPQVASVEDDEADDDAVVPHESPIVPVPGVPAGSGQSFWKQLSRFDASTTSAPGQIIIPREFWRFFDVQDDVGDLDQRFPARYMDGGFVRDLGDARIKTYPPKPSHPRPNNELRFMFRDRQVSDRLSENDVLVFGRESDLVTVRRRSTVPVPGVRWGWL
jgi:hypothetical protein